MSQQTKISPGNVSGRNPLLKDSGRVDFYLVSRRIAPCRMVVCASRELLEQIGPLQTVAELRRVPRLIFSGAVSTGDWTLIDSKGSSHVFVFDAHIASGDLVALLPAHRTLDLAIHAVYPTHRHVSLKLRSFVDHLAARLGSTTP